MTTHRAIRRSRLWFGAFAVVMAACSPAEENANAGAAAAEATTEAAAPESASAKPPVEYGEYVARPEELDDVPANEIIKSLRLNAAAMMLGRQVYAQHCAACHGEDLKGLPDAHTPDLTDTVWMFASDDLPSGGTVMHPSDVEWTVRYGVRSGNENARGADVDMVAFDPKYRNARDTSDFGPIRTLTDSEMEDVAEYVLQLGGQPHDAARAARGAVLFQDNAKGNCYDCHNAEGTGIRAFGSTDLTRPDLYLYGSDRASILESIVRGRVGTMPAFDTVLTPRELKAVSVYVFDHAQR